MHVPGAQHQPSVCLACMAWYAGSQVSDTTHCMLVSLSLDPKGAAKTVSGCNVLCHTSFLGHASVTPARNMNRRMKVRSIFNGVSPLADPLAFRCMVIHCNSNTVPMLGNLRAGTNLASWPVRMPSKPLLKGACVRSNDPLRYLSAKLGRTCTYLLPSLTHCLELQGSTVAPDQGP